MEGRLLYDRLFTSSRRRKIRLVATNAAMGILGHEHRQWGGSVPGHRVIHRDREGAWNELKQRYFDENPLFDAATFRRRFCMEPSLWYKICREVCAAKRYFMFKPDAVGKMGFHGGHKCVVAMRMLAYGTIADALDDGYAMAESTVLECVREFATTIIQLYESEYLRAPTQSELSRILAENEARGFPGMIGSIDCMHWEWRGCPVSHHGQYQNRKGKPTMILEVVATKDLRVWHAFFGMPGYRPSAVNGAAAMAGRKGTHPARSAHSRICYPSAHGHWCCRRLADPPNPFALVCTPPPTSTTTQQTAWIYRNTATNQHHSTAPIHRCYRNHGARGGQILLPISTPQNHT